MMLFKMIIGAMLSLTIAVSGYADNKKPELKIDKLNHEVVFENLKIIPGFTSGSKNLVAEVKLKNLGSDCGMAIVSAHLLKKSGEPLRDPKNNNPISHGLAIMDLKAGQVQFKTQNIGMQIQYPGAVKLKVADVKCLSR